MSARRAFVAVLAGAASAGPAAALTPTRAAANPPAPKVLPDPPVAAPKTDEPPTMVRKHEGVCFAFYPSGGALPVACPPDLRPTPVGQAIVRAATGRCQWVPLASGEPGARVGWLEACPAAFAEVATAHVVPEAARHLLAAAHAAHEDDFQPGYAPPRPARLDPSPPQSVGCAVEGRTGRSHLAPDARCAVALLACAVVRRRRRRL